MGTTVEGIVITLLLRNQRGHVDFFSTLSVRHPGEGWSYGGPRARSDGYRCQEVIPRVCREWTWTASGSRSRTDRRTAASRRSTSRGRVRSDGSIVAVPLVSLPVRAGLTCLPPRSSSPPGTVLRRGTSSAGPAPPDATSLGLSGSAVRRTIGPCGWATERASRRTRRSRCPATGCLRIGSVGVSPGSPGQERGTQSVRSVNSGWPPGPTATFGRPGSLSSSAGRRHTMSDISV